MKLLLAILFCLSVDSYAATRKIVPRADGEGGIGTSSKKWGTSYFKYGVDVATVVASAEITAGTTTITGAAYIGASNSVSTITAAGVLTLNGGMTATTGALSSTLDVNGNVTLGADNYVTTNTASSGAWAFPAAVSIGGTLTQSGDVKAGAANYVSTFTAATGVYAITGAVTSLGAITGASLTANSGALTLYSRTEAQILALDPAVVGELYFCSDCTTTAVCVSTGAAVAQVAAIEDPTAACD